MAFPYAFVTGAAETLTKKKEEEREAERRAKELALQGQLQKELRMTPEAISPEQAGYYKARGEADIQQAATQDLETKSNMWQKMIDPTSGKFYKGKEVLGHLIEAELLKNYGGVFRQGGALAEGGGNTPKEIARLGAIREFVNNATAENRKKIMDVSGYETGVSGEEQEAIVDETGNIVGYRPKGAVFQPQGETITSTDITQAQKLIPWWERFIPGTQTQAGKDVTALRKKMIERKLGKQVTQQPQGRIKVRIKTSGLTGTIEAKEFDPAIYEKL